MNNRTYKIRLVAGLGNPGDTYKNTRHNIGFTIIDSLANHFKATSWKKSFNALCTEIKIQDDRIIFLKPMTYMNNSGAPLQACASFYKIAPEEILVIHDELDLTLGKIKAKLGGGNGGHNGIKSIESTIGKQFYRLRLGIGRPEDKTQVSNYVLSNFSSSEEEVMNNISDNISSNFCLLLNPSLDNFMNKVNT